MYSKCYKYLHVSRDLEERPTNEDAIFQYHMFIKTYKFNIYRKKNNMEMPDKRERFGFKVLA